MNGQLLTEVRAPALAGLLDRAAEQHGHLCPRQVLGVRSGLLAGELLGLALPQADKRLFTFVETDGCFADGVAAATGCWFGRRTLRLVDHGKVAATFVDTLTRQAIRVWPHRLARSRAVAAMPAAPNRWQAQLEAYQWLPAAELLCAAPVTLTVSLAAIISQPGRRAICARCEEEIINEREVYVAGQVLCRACAGDRYFALT